MHNGPHDGGGGDDAEGGEEELAEVAAERHAEGHTAILGEMEKTPAADEGYLLAYLHVGLDPELEDLVGDEDDGDDEDDDECLFARLGHLAKSLRVEKFKSLIVK